ncbi:MAG: hypothetical protein QOH42_2482, partial [Blastocatellia bacterium]|nr:hypothetical protein [Blastocatellia bacterium]
MKRCNTCSEEFKDSFRFCPVDGMPLDIAPAQLEGKSAAGDFHLTLISEEALTRRLVNQLRFLVDQVRQAWPSLKNDPIAFSARRVHEITRSFKQNLLRPHVLSAATTALFVVGAIILSVLILERQVRKVRAVDLSESGDELVRTVEIDLRGETKHDNDSGVGVGGKGRVGLGEGKGEGSNPKPARSHGGGSGGDGSLTPPSQGRVPVPSIIPAPISTTMARLPQTLPDAGIDLDAALWKNLSYTSYGDPRSKSTTTSNGPGEGGGVGTNKGTGIGEGDGPGFGPGRKGNIGDGDKSPGCCGGGGSSGNNPNPDPDRIYRVSELNERARVLSKPEPQYTE